MISERNNIAASYTAQGNQKAQEIKNATSEQVTIILAQAQKQADTLIAEGDAEYMKILKDEGTICIQLKSGTYHFTNH